MTDTNFKKITLIIFLAIFSREVIDFLLTSLFFINPEERIFVQIVSMFFIPVITALLISKKITPTGRSYFFTHIALSWIIGNTFFGFVYLILLKSNTSSFLPLLQSTSTETALSLVVLLTVTLLAKHRNKDSSKKMATT